MPKNKRKEDCTKKSFYTLNKKMEGDFVMKNGFDLEMYETLFRECFIEYSTYSNGNMRLCLYGIDPEINETAHFADITLEQNSIKLNDDEIIVNNHFKPTLVPQLEKLGILKEKVKNCIVENTFYPIYKIDFSKVIEKCYYIQDLVAA